MTKNPPGLPKDWTLPAFAGRRPEPRPEPDASPLKPRAAAPRKRKT